MISDKPEKDDIENMKKHKFLIKAMRENIALHKEEQMRKIIGLDI